MRATIFAVCFLFTCTVLTAQTDLRGSYIRYACNEKGGHTRQALNLYGATSGKYTLTEKGGDAPDFTSGYWLRKKIWRRHTDSIPVVVLSYENEHHVTYLEIERTGCLTPIYDNGDRIKRANAFAPAKR